MIQEMHERLKNADERRNCGADEEIVSLRAALAAKDAEITELKEQHAREIERIKKNHGCARHQGMTQFCQEAVDAHKEADAMRADAALGAAVRKEIAELEHKRDNDCILSDIEDEWLNDLQTLVAEAGLMKGEER